MSENNNRVIWGTGRVVDIKICFGSCCCGHPLSPHRPLLLYTDYDFYVCQVGLDHVVITVYFLIPILKQ